MDSRRNSRRDNTYSTGVIQINLGKGKAATNALLRVMEEDGIAVAAIQEPHVRDGKVLGFGAWCVVSRGKAPRAVILHNKNTKPIMIGHLSDEYLVAAEFKGGAGQAWYLISAYVPPVENKTVDFTRRIQRLEDAVTELSARGEVVVAGDFNAKSVAWGSPRDCPRGRRLCESIEAMDTAVGRERGGRLLREGLV